MKREAGAATAFAVLLAVLGISYLPRQGAEPQPNPQQNAKPTSPKAVPTKDQAASETCAKIQTRLNRFLDRKILEQNLPRSCSKADAHNSAGDPHLKGADPNLKFAIALVPDPVTTHLQLMHDALIDVIQQAAQDDNYSYDASWLPWDDAPKEYPLLADQQMADEIRDVQESQPGVLAFRSDAGGKTGQTPYGAGLIVFLVAEQPTRGISDKQFENALAWIFALGGAEGASGTPLRILGPTFSGSLPSLARGLLTPVNRPLEAGLHSIQVISGSVSSKSSIDRFLRSWNAAPRPDFQTMQESDDLIVERFLRYLRSAGYSLQNIAVLSEDETAFGETGKLEGQRTASDETSKIGEADCRKTANNETWLLDKPESCTVHLYYPRDIATLRSAYEQQGIFRAGKQQNPNSPGTTLRGDLSEPANSDHDTVRTYAGQLTPLAQEAVLIGIGEVLRNRNIEFVIIRSTNPLDQIFLSQFLRRSNPAARVVLDGVDLLFSHGAEGGSLRGVMTLSTYPLAAREQDWTPSLRFRRNGAYRVFRLDAAEGTYIAARKLFGLEPNLKVPIHDYAPPVWALSRGGFDAEDQRPPTWVSVIGHGQFWPLAVLNQTTLTGSSASELLRPWPHFDDVDRPLLEFTGEITALLMFCLLWAAGHYYCCRQGSLYPLPRGLAGFAPTPGREHDALILFGSALLVAVAVMTASNLGLFSTQWEPLRWGLLAAWTLIMLRVAFVSCVANCRIPALSAEPEPALPPGRFSRDASAAFRMSRILLYALLAAYFLQIQRFTLANEALVYWRNTSLVSGVAPLMPMVLLVAGLYGWFWFNLQGFALLGDDRPRLPKTLATGAWMSAFSDEQAAQPVEQALRWLRRPYYYGLSLLVFFVITALFLLQALHWQSLRTLGDRRFGVFILSWLCLDIALVLTDILQVVRTWAKLRLLLVSLDRLVVRRTLNALKGLSWGSVWSMSGNVLEERYRVMSRQFESLRHLLNLVEEWMPTDAKEIEARKQVIAKLKTCRVAGRAFAAWYIRLMKEMETTSNGQGLSRPAARPWKGPPMPILKPLYRFQTELASTAGLVLQKVLLPAWQKEKHSLLFDPERMHPKSGEESEKETKGPAHPGLPGGELEPHVAASEEFFVLPYVGFIQNILGRIRTIVLGSLCVFVSATLAVSSYPFQPIPVLGGAFLLLFLISGAALAIVYAEIHRDATLSNLTHTTPGELDGHFWLELFTFGIGPLLGLLTALFPSVTDFIVSWIQPSAQALK